MCDHCDLVKKLQTEINELLKSHEKEMAEIEFSPENMSIALFGLGIKLAIINDIDSGQVVTTFQHLFNQEMGGAATLETVQGEDADGETVH